MKNGKAFSQRPSPTSRGIQAYGNCVLSRSLHACDHVQKIHMKCTMPAKRLKSSPSPRWRNRFPTPRGLSPQQEFRKYPTPIIHIHTQPSEGRMCQRSFFLMRCVPSGSIRTNQFNYATELATNWLDCSTHWFALISKKTANASINAPSRQWYLG